MVEDGGRYGGGSGTALALCVLRESLLQVFHEFAKVRYGLTLQ